MMPKPQFEHVRAHWATSCDAFQTSSRDFYRSVDEAIRRREIPELHLSRVVYRESGALSAKREYLRVERRGLHFDICAAPFGTGFFFSWWQVAAPPRFGILFGFILTLVELFVARQAYVYFSHH